MIAEVSALLALSFQFAMLYKLQGFLTLLASGNKMHKDTTTFFVTMMTMPT
jgi:hypothetical protein